MQYGFFDDKRKEYVIETPATPMPWINYLGSQNPRLHTDEILIALSISAATSPDAARALNAVPLLKGCEVHSSVLLSSVDEGIFKKLGMHLTCEPKNEEKDVKKQ